MSHALYLNFNGNCEEAMNFYKEKLDGNIKSIQHFGETPEPGPAEYKDKVMHGIMDFQGFTVMFSDSMGAHNVQFGNNFSIALDFKNDGEMRRAFDAISTNGGTVTMPLEDTFWGAVFGMCTDKFGINWMFNFDKPKN